jgi:hypothetical protein
MAVDIEHQGAVDEQRIASAISMSSAIVPFGTY